MPAAGDETREESGSIVLGLDFIRSTANVR